MIASVIEHPRPRCGREVNASVNASNARADFLQKVKENARRERRERIAIITKKEIEDYLHKKLQTMNLN